MSKKSDFRRNLFIAKDFIKEQCINKISVACKTKKVPEDTARVLNTVIENSINDSMSKVYKSLEKFIADEG